MATQTNRATFRHGARANPEDMMWQGVRPKAKANLLDQSQISENFERVNRASIQHSQNSKTIVASAHGEQTVNSHMLQNQLAADGGDSHLYQNHSSLTTMTKEEPNFPINPLMSKHMSHNNAQPHGLQRQNFAAIVGSDDTLHERRSTQQTVSRKSSKPQMKKVDYTDIPHDFVRQQRAQQAQHLSKTRGKSLRASRFTDVREGESMMATLPVQTDGRNGNGRFGSIDVNFKRQIDLVKQNRAQSMLPATMGSDDNETPLKARQNNLQHNDSIYQSSVNQSMNSGLGLTPQHRFETNTGEKRRNQAPFGTATDHKQGPHQKVPPILLSNENQRKYVGHKHQTQFIQQQDFASPSFTYSQQKQSPRHATAGHASILSRDPGSTAYSQPEDSMFQQSEISMSQQQQRNRFQKANLLPKIGSANPQINNRFKHSQAGGHTRDTSINQQNSIHMRHLSTAQPNHVGLKFQKSPVQSQQTRSRSNAVGGLNDTGFNWKQVEIKTNKGQFDSTQRSGATQNIHVPAAYRKDYQKNNIKPGALLDMMEKVNHKGPIRHKVVSSNEFERLAQANANMDGGRPMIEKTIFIVKPIYVPVHVPVTAKNSNNHPQMDIGLQGKKRIKVKCKQQKAIYTEKPQPANYRHGPPEGKAPAKRTRTKRQRAQDNRSRSPSPFSAERSINAYDHTLNQSSIDMVHPSMLHSFGAQEDQLSHAVTQPDELNPTANDFKKLLNSSKIIDEIFQKRQNKMDAAAQIEAEKKAQEERELAEVIDANRSLKDSLAGRNSTGSKMTLMQQMSIDPAGGVFGDDKSSINGGKPVDTTKEFLNTINDQLHNSGAGIQIIMEESKNAQWFQKQKNDTEKISKQYSKMRKWQVAPKTFAATEITHAELEAAKERERNNGKTHQNTAVGGGYQSGTDQQMQMTRGQQASGATIPNIDNSPSGAMLSERRWNSPTNQSVGTRDRFIMPQGGSQSPTSHEAKSPFGVRSNGRSLVGSHTRLSQQRMITVQDQENNQLTVERIAAMKLMTKKMKKVGKVPIEMENHFCSHLDAATSAQLIAANEFTGQNNQFKHLWKDREHRAPVDDFSQVPRHYYSNYKTNMIRDAHYMAKAIVNARSVSPAVRSNHCLGDCGQPSGSSIQCGCNKRKPKPELKKNKFRSFLGGIRSNTRSKGVAKRAYNLYKPYRPCRRTCCANHNPLYHAERMQQEHLQRMHASATKLMIMKVIPERPYSADSATRALKAYQREIDYFRSTIHGEALVRKQSKSIRRGTTIDAKSLKSVEGIEERGEIEEDDKQTSLKSKDLLSIGPMGAGSRITASNMNLMKSQLDGSATLDEQSSLSFIECKYLISVLKNRSIQATQIKEKQFDTIYVKARKTLKIQMKKLLLKKQFYIIDKQYKLAENEKQTSVNLVKILARCLKMFDAQTEIYKIIYLIETRLEKVKQLKKEQYKEQPDPEVFRNLYQDLVRQSYRIFGSLRTLKDIEKSLSRPFMFNGDMYDGDFMIKQIKRKRVQILNQYPALAQTNELQMLLSEAGELSDVKNLTRQEIELNDDESLYSASDSEEEDDEVGVDQSELQELNRLNEQSNEKLRGLDKRSTFNAEQTMQTI